MNGYVALAIPGTALYLAVRLVRSLRRKAKIKAFWRAVEGHVAAYTGGTNTAQLPVLSPTDHAYRPLAGERLMAVQDGVSRVALRSTGRYVNRGISFSIPIVKGVRYRVGSGTRTSEKAWQTLDTGRLLLTEKAVVFDGASNERLAWAQIAEVDVLIDGVQISKRTGPPRMYRVYALDPHFAALLWMMSRHVECVPVKVPVPEAPTPLPTAPVSAPSTRRGGMGRELAMGAALGVGVFAVCAGMYAALSQREDSSEPVATLTAPTVPETASDWGSTVVTSSIAKPNADTFTCSASPVPLPVAERMSTIAQCRAAVRSQVRTMLANIEVTVLCREQYVQAVGPSLPAARVVRANNEKLLSMLPTLQSGAEEQLAKNSTLASCKRQLASAQRLTELQPELRGEWQGHRNERSW